MTAELPADTAPEAPAPARVRRVRSPGAWGSIFLRDNLEAMPLPNGAPHFVAARKGYYVDKNMFFGRVMVPVTEIPTLPDLPGTGAGVLWLNVPPFPIEMLGQAWSFFRWATEKRNSEAMLDITWDKEHGYRFFVPPQTATGGGVKCVRNEEHYKADLIGTIHSHCNMGAYHSSTDTHDADSHDGLHMTMGRVSANQPELDIMVSANKVQWNKIKFEEVFDHEGPIPMVAHPEWWQNYHEHQYAVEQFRGQRFAGGQKVGAESAFPLHRPGTSRHPGAIWSGNHQAGQSPFRNHTLNEAEDLAARIVDANLIEGVDPYQYFVNIDFLADQMKELIDEFRDHGINLNLQMWADRKYLEEMRGLILAKYALSRDDDGTITYDPAADSEDEPQPLPRVHDKRRNDSKRGKKQ